MFALPSIPSWDALHPAVSHFPIVLLVIAPLFLLLALFREERKATFLSLAFWFMVAGTVGIYLAAATGDAARDVAPRTATVVKAIEDHESAGSAIRATFSVLTCLLAVLLYGPRLSKRVLPPSSEKALTAVLLVLAIAAFVPLSNAAHTGGRLVHSLGVHARL